jgi:hypothetical protein
MEAVVSHWVVAGEAWQAPVVASAAFFVEVGSLDDLCPDLLRPRLMTHQNLPSSDSYIIYMIISVSNTIYMIITVSNTIYMYMIISVSNTIYMIISVSKSTNCRLLVCCILI